LCTVTARHDGALADEVGTAGIERHDLGARRLADPLALMRFLVLLRRQCTDLVHAHGQDAAVLARWARRVGQFRLVITRHVLDEPSRGFRQRVRQHAAISAVRAADAVVAVSKSAADRLSELASLPRTRIEVIPNGIELDRYDPAGNAVGASRVRRELGLGPDTVAVLVPAVLRPGKGHDTLLAAVPRVRRHVPDAAFLLAGDGELADALGARAQQLGGAVRMLGHRNDMPGLMAAAAVVCLPSRSEAFPTVLLEAAASGRPVVATRVGGVPEVVDHGRTGILVPPADPAALAQALAELLQDAARRRRLGETALARARSDFAVSCQAGQTTELWRRVLGERAV
jgi:glycosyltransferase involved in cell wall biosynthesis